MGRRISILALTALLVLGLSIANAQAVNSVNYLGKSTWTVTITESTTVPSNVGATFTITGGVSKVGDEFYLFQGYVTAGTDGPFVLSGSGFLMGTTLKFTLSTSQEHTNSQWRDSGVMHVSMDKTTLNGTFYEVALHYDRGAKKFDQSFTAGTLVRSGSPIPLSSSLAPQILLME